MERIVVVGGGVVGLSIAWRAAQAGGRVTVVDANPGRGASWAAAGMLAPVTEAHYGEDALLALTLESSRRWPDFAAELADAAGTDTGYRRCGTLTVARDGDDAAVLDELLAFQTRLGLRVQRLTGREARRAEPGLAPRVRGAILVDGDHQVDNRALVTALLRACERAGVALIRDAAAAVTGDGAADGVRLRGGGRLPADAVVLAAGAWSGQVGLPEGARMPPVRPVKGQLLHLRGPADRPVATRNIRGLDVYVVPRPDGRVVVGATVEEQGYDTRVTAGAVADLLRAAWELLPGTAELELVETTAGLRPGSPDNAPLLGSTAVDGLLVATGHYRNGVLLAPVTAAGIVECLAGGRPPLLAPFQPARFDTIGALR